MKNCIKARSLNISILFPFKSKHTKKLTNQKTFWIHQFQILFKQPKLLIESSKRKKYHISVILPIMLHGGLWTSVISRQSFINTISHLNNYYLLFSLVYIIYIKGEIKLSLIDQRMRIFSSIKELFFRRMIHSSHRPKEYK